MSALSSVDSSLENVYNDAPKLPEKAREVIASIVPWLCLIGGVLGLMSALALWHWAHATNSLVDYANQLSQAYGLNTVATHRLSVAVWLSLVTLVVESVLYLMAFAPTKARQRRGWDLLFYAILFNAVVGFVMLFNDYGGSSNFISYLIGTVIGLYFLYQIKPKYSK